MTNIFVNKNVNNYCALLPDEFQNGLFHALKFIYTRSHILCINVEHLPKTSYSKCHLFWFSVVAFIVEFIWNCLQEIFPLFVEKLHWRIENRKFSSTKNAIVEFQMDFYGIVKLLITKKNTTNLNSIRTIVDKNMENNFWSDLLTDIVHNEI